jgi:ubiquinone/menaquinone biosynthesis C-methylase UbiE
MGSCPELETAKDAIRDNLSRYTRRAFGTLPALESPRILDIGCGSGVPTIVLAEISNGKIVAVDNDMSRLELLKGKIKTLGLEGRIEMVNCSARDLSFHIEGFDIIWSEGSIFAVGFERGLPEWGRYLKPGGFLAVHDEIGDLRRKIEYIPDCGYDLLDYFVLNHTVWWDEYYAPLERKIDELMSRYGDRPEFSADLEKERREISLFKGEPRKFESVFFIIRKSGR